MAGTGSPRVFIQSLTEFVQKEVVLRGWVCRMRVLGKTTFVVLKDCSNSMRDGVGRD
jgi:nondiscriminating aspartyl-tRNA synthetase